MTSAQLARSVLSRLLDFAATRPSGENAFPQFDFENFFRKTEKTGLGPAIIQTLSVFPVQTDVIGTFLAALPGVEIVSGNGRNFIQIDADRIGPLVSGENQEAAERAFEDFKPFPDAAPSSAKPSPPTCGEINSGSAVGKHTHSASSPSQPGPRPSNVLAMSKEELKAVVLEDVREFEEECRKCPTIGRFETFFTKRHHCPFRQSFRSVFGFSKKDSDPNSALRLVPGIDLFEHNEKICVRTVRQGCVSAVDGPAGTL